MEVNVWLSFLKSVKGNNLVKKLDRVMTLCQIVALVMVSKCVKFEEDNFNIMEIIDNVKVLWTTQTLTLMAPML